MTVPRNNDELYVFLRGLKRELTVRGSKELAEILDAALACSPLMSTEFLGESRMGLWRLLRDGKGELSAHESREVEEVIRRIDDRNAGSPR